MILTDRDQPAGPNCDANQTLIEAILRSDEPEGMNPARLHNDLPMCRVNQRQRRWDRE